MRKMLAYSVLILMSEPGSIFNYQIDYFSRHVNLIELL